MDETIREKERAALAGDVEAGQAAARDAARTGKVVGDVAHKLRQPFCCLCGKRAALIRASVYVQLEPEYGYRWETESHRREAMDGTRPIAFKIGYSVGTRSIAAFEETEKGLREGLGMTQDTVQAVDVRCENDHGWQTHLVAFELAHVPEEPDPEPEEKVIGIIAGAG